MDYRTKIVTALLALLLAGCSHEYENQGQDPGGSSPELGWESSGGSGVVCFATEEQAAVASASLKRDGHLSDNDRKAVDKAYILDRWDYQFLYRFTRYDGRRPDQILEGVNLRFRQWAPLFSHKLDLAMSRVRFSDWNDNKALRKVDDAKPKVGVEEIDSQCKHIQFVTRYSRSKAGHLPEVRTEADLWLIKNKLAAVDRAMLEFHEVLYLIGKESVHRNSDHLRKVVAYFFSDNVVDDLNKQIEHEQKVRQRGIVDIKNDILPARVIQNPLKAMLGDYFKYFLSDKEDKPSTFSTGPSQYTRYQSLIALMERLYERHKLCFERAGFNKFGDKAPEEEKKRCYQEAINVKSIESTLSDEVSFIYLSFFILDLMRLIEMPEDLVVWNRENGDRSEPHQAEELQRACTGIDHLIAKPRKGVSPELLEKAQAYCASALFL